MSFTTRFLSTKDVAEALGCSIPTARKIMLKRDFPLIKVGRSMKVEEHAFYKWASERHTK